MSVSPASPESRSAKLRVDPDAAAAGALRQRSAALAADLEPRLRGAVRFGRHDRMLYATDASIYQVEPLGIVVPADADDAVTAVRWAAEHRLPLLPRGGGTSLGGQCTAEAVVLDVSAGLTGIGPLDVVEGRVRAEAGVNLADLNAAIADDGVFFAPDPSTVRQANVGGCIGNNAAGTRSIRYGRTAENLLAVDACLAGGERVRFEAGAAATAAEGDPVRRITDAVIAVVDEHAVLIRERFPRTLRRNAGYALDMILDQIEAARSEGRDPRETVNLAHLVCGSEGTLAVTLAADLVVHPLPKAKGLAVIGFGDLDEAIAAVEPLLAVGPSAVELLDDLIVSLAERNTEYRTYVRLMPQPTGGGTLQAVLYVELWEPDANAVQRGFDAVRRIIAERAPTATVAAYEDPVTMARALKLRSAGEPLLHGLPGRRKPLGFVEDNAVPVERLGEFVRRFRGIVEAEGTRASFYAHASVGVLHVRPLLDPKDPEDRQRMERIAVSVADLAKELGGVMSGEHGDGRVRGPLLERFFGPELMGAFRDVKRIFDPDGRLNPGNIVDPQPIESIHERLRVRPDGTNVDVPATETWFAFEDEHGFDHAIEMCNGAGVCRKRSGGTMCPSYRATNDERHSTRGRGNALRLAITGQLSGDGRPAWDDPETMATLDLCLSCKACASECPSNVDVATYKAEYLAQSYRAAGRVPLAARVFGHVRTMNRLGSAFAPLSNVIAEWRPIRAMTNRMLGLAPKRSLPAFAPSLFRRLQRARPRMNAGLSADAPAVVLYADCFSTYNEPEVGEAAVRLLNAFGYRVDLPRIGCCGRPPVSTGLLDVAAGCRDDAAAVLARALDDGAEAVMVLEPSCLSAIRDEWLDLRSVPGGTVPDRTRLESIAARTHLVEAFLHDRWEVHPRRPSFTRPAGPVAFHGHCHQKSMGEAGAGAGAGLLGRIAGDALESLDTGCCGMAGSFGYVDRRYAVSMAVGEDGLFPLVRGLPAEATVCAPGTSCRHQIADGTGRGACHPVVFAASHLEVSGADGETF